MKSYRDALMKPNTFPNDILRVIILFSMSKGLFIILWPDLYSEYDGCHLCGLLQLYWPGNGYTTTLDAYSSNKRWYFKLCCTQKCQLIADAIDRLV